MNGYLDTALLLVTYLLTIGLTVCVRNALLKRAVLDHPNERSSHKIPVPRGGGWALLIVLAPGMLIIGLMQHSLILYAGLIAGTILLAFISWLDDRKGGVSIGLRLSIHVAAACLGSLAFTPQETLFGGVLPFWLDRSLMIVGWAWFLNLYNFMDGIDGITGVETISIATGVCLILSAANVVAPFADTLTILLIGSCLGFLALNWHPAKIFLGDVGSIPLGYLAGFLLVTLAVHGNWAPALIIPAYYITDSGITIIRRALNGEKFWKAHRQHFYQRCAQRVRRHDLVVIWIAAANIGLIGAAVIAANIVTTGIVLGAAMVTVLLWRMNKL